MKANFLVVDAILSLFDLPLPQRAQLIRGYGGSLLAPLVHPFPAKEYKIVVVRLDNASKTTTLYKLHLEEVVVTQPTIGSNVEEVIFKNVRFEVWHLGGQDSLRPSWATYYRGTRAIWLVVDSRDRARITAVKDELFRLLQHNELQQAVVLVFANTGFERVYFKDNKEAYALKKPLQTLVWR
ncbi:hypothetical protein L7F22_046180 [Adiantum nelumboides]|nr:hypothetical protein [Adiantum nelumboides]